MTATKKYLIAVVLDQSGSMQLNSHQTVSGFNEFLLTQQNDPNGEAWFSLTLFNSMQVDKRFVAKPIKEVPDLGTEGNPYSPGGGTPLYDAIGVTIGATEKIAKDYDSVLFLIQTDGQENESKEWTREKIFDLITEKRKPDGDNWSFVFMGADQDAYTASASIGVALASTMSYAGAQSLGAFTATSGATTSFRASGGKTGSTFYAKPVPTSSGAEPDNEDKPAATTSSDDISKWRKS